MCASQERAWDSASACCSSRSAAEAHLGARYGSGYSSAGSLDRPTRSGLASSHGNAAPSTPPRVRRTQTRLRLLGMRREAPDGLLRDVVDICVIAPDEATRVPGGTPRTWRRARIARARPRAPASCRPARATAGPGRIGARCVTDLDEEHRHRRRRASASTPRRARCAPSAYSASVAPPCSAAGRTLIPTRSRRSRTARPRPHPSSRCTRIPPNACRTPDEARQYPPNRPDHDLHSTPMENASALADCASRAHASTNARYERW